MWKNGPKHCKGPERVTTLPPCPQLSFCVWLSAQGCVKKKIFISFLQKAYLLGVSIKPLSFEDNQTVHYTVNPPEGPQLKHNPVCKPEHEMRINKKADVLIHTTVPLFTQSRPI